MQRYSDYPLPKTRYEPGRTPRSVKEISKQWLEAQPYSGHLDTNSWKTCQHYLYAIDLFNYGYWWEAHEILEGLWVEQGRKGDIALFIQGLIQVAAALLKKNLSVPGGARRLSLKGMPKMARQEETFLGVAVHQFVDDVEDYITGKSAIVPTIELAID